MTPLVGEFLGTMVLIILVEALWPMFCFHAPREREQAG